MRLISQMMKTLDVCIPIEAEVPNKKLEQQMDFLP